jgi:CRISPR system Cascade subunit CasC
MSLETSDGRNPVWKPNGKALSLHLLTVMPPHNVNRDEDGRPKTAMFGTTLRGRISSQARKRALRFAPHFPGGQRAMRTREFGIQVYREAVKAGVGALDEADAAWLALAVNHAVGGGGKKPTREDATLITDPEKASKEATTKSARDAATKATRSRDEKVAKFIEELHLDQETALRRSLEEELRTEQGLVISTVEREAGLDHVMRLRDKPDAERSKAVATTVEELGRKGLLDRASIDIDLALFGRMVAAMPDFNVEAAASVSHAITTHTFDVEADYFSAGEELNKLGGTGAAITSYGFFGSGVYYQHATLNAAQLLENLGGRKKLATQAVKQFLHGLMHVQPKGKRNAFASDTAAPYALARITVDAPTVNLGFAFVDPIVAEGRNGDLMLASIRRLREFDQTVHDAYNIKGETKAFVAYPPARKQDTNVAPPGEAWTYDEFESFALGVLE